MRVAEGTRASPPDLLEQSRDAREVAVELVDGEPVVRDGMTPARERYFDERLRAA